jgi:biopolymer transport protein ExbD
MAQMEIQTAESKKTKRKLHSALRIDMTPMVDLGFLLITFFIFTTTMSDKTTMRLYMPHDGDSSVLGESKVLTVLLGNNNKVYAFEGTFEDALKNNKIIATSYDESDGIGNQVREKQKQLLQLNKKDDLVFLIKPTKQSTYKNVIDALDEATINGVKKYMIVDASSQENQFLKE